jgi:hypothetical protein
MHLELLVIDDPVNESEVEYIGSASHQRGEATERIRRERGATRRSGQREATPVKRSVLSAPGPAQMTGALVHFS